MTAPSPWTRLRGWLFDGGDLDMPPERVRAVIRDQQDRSEILVSCAQLAAAALFAILYAVARMAEGQADHVTLASAIHFFWSMVGADPETGWIGPLYRLLDRIEFVFGALAIYTAATIARLALALRRRLRPWMLYGSAAMDMALLMAVIWSFHLKYGQPAAFYLKAPTFVYVFIFIALRALRFEARFVLFAGAMGALGPVPNYSIPKRRAR